MKRNLRMICFFILCMFSSASAFSHCQMPCGIYDDQMRISMIKEYIITVEKSMKQIQALSGQKDKNHNQIVRWVNTKDDHADKINEVASGYFMTQRLNPADLNDPSSREGYVQKLSLLHRLMFYAMKAKQTTDLSFVSKMRGTIDEFSDAYFSK